VRYQSAGFGAVIHLDFVLDPIGKGTVAEEHTLLWLLLLCVCKRL
jgi:hypothetical protein